MTEKQPSDRETGWRTALPRNGPGPYAVADGRVLTDGVEVVIAAHCNLRCRACAYLSPVLPVSTVPPAQIASDLRTLARSFHASEARVLGGEPLLHPQLIQVLRAVKTSEVSDTIRVITNGLLLARVPPDFWRLADEVSVSVYPGREPPADVMVAATRLADEQGVRLRVKYFRYFRESYSELGPRATTLAKRIYRTCQMANVWRCNTVLNGYLYRCPQSAYLPSALTPTAIDGGPDGLAISGAPGFRDRLLEFLESAEPLNTCTNCLGSVGRLFAHEQVSRTAWRNPQQYHTEQLLDWDHLTMLEGNPGLLVRDTSYLPIPAS